MDSDDCSYGESWPIKVDKFEKVEVSLHQNGLVLSFKAWEEEDDDENGWDVKGFLKWDGCLDFETNPNCYYHLCNPTDMTKLTLLFNRIGDEARSRIPNYEGNFHTESNKCVIGTESHFPLTADEIFKSIAHGDQEHRDWLKEAMNNIFSGDPVPPPRGKGTDQYVSPVV